MKLESAQIAAFQDTLRAYYLAHGRHELPWRQPEAGGLFDPYKIMVSELMLQQTQVNRVIPKYLAFIESFPSAEVLAQAQLSNVLIAWQGLGYNRRAKFLWQAAKHVHDVWHDEWPRSVNELTQLPGVGANTAGAIAAYAFNEPVSYIETNVRSVYFHHFFDDKTDITDKELLDVIAQTVDQQNPREFYWALMDYGTHLKQQGHGKITRSKHYTKQSTFEGSRRQVRGKVLRLLAAGPLPQDELLEQVADDRTIDVLDELVEEGLIRSITSTYKLA